MTTLTADRLRELLFYDRETGVFTRRIRTSNRINVGDEAGGLCSNGYRQIVVEGHHYYAHRLAWLYVTGEWPPVEIDHINGIRDNNRWANLRAATRSQNAANTGRRKDNKSGFKGVHWNSHARRWQAMIRINQKTRFLGSFDTPEDASAAYAAASVKLNGSFAKHGSDLDPCFPYMGRM